MQPTTCLGCGRRVNSPERAASEPDGPVRCAACRTLALAADEPLLPVVLAADPYGDGRFHFRCPNPDCRRSLSVRRVDPELVMVCPRKTCGTEMRVITAGQRSMLLRKRHERQEEERRRREERWESAPDQVVVLGRPQSGKTVFLSVLYRNLWRSTGDLSAHAADGEGHRTLLEQYESMCRGRWPEGGQGTLDVRQHDWTIRHDGATLHLSTMDYPGEIYRKVFFEKKLDQPECLTLFRQVDSAMAVLLLLDPRHVVEDELDVIDLEFSCVQVVEHLKEKGLEQNFLVVLTKRDQNAPLLARYGGPRRFVRKFLPRLAEVAPDAPVLSLWAMPEARSEDGAVLLNEEGQTIPRPPPEGEAHVLVPLRRLLDGIDPELREFLSDMDRETSRRAAARTRRAPPSASTGTAPEFFVSEDP